MAAEPGPQSDGSAAECHRGGAGAGLPGVTGFPSLILKPRLPGSGLEDDHSEAMARLDAARLSRATSKIVAFRRWIRPWRTTCQVPSGGCRRIERRPRADWSC